MLPPKKIPFTKDGYQKLQIEYDETQKLRKYAVDDLKIAREMGDLSENGYYKAARMKLSSIDANLRRLKRLVDLGEIVATNGGNKVHIGCSVVITDGKHTLTFQLVGGYESNPSLGKISQVSPLGKALLGRKKGDKISISAPAGDMEYKIKEIL